MPPLDAAVAHVLDHHNPTTANSDSDDEDALIALLEDDSSSSSSHAVSAFREQRLEQLHAELSRAKHLRTTHNHGTYAELTDEKHLMSLTTSTKLCVVHFKKPDFPRCRIMDSKLRVLAEKHFDTRFVSIDVENAPFLVVKLGVKVLPCVLPFVEGVCRERIVGFEGLGYGGGDGFTVGELEGRLLGCGVLVRAKVTGEEEEGRRGGRQVAARRGKVVEDENEDDWD